MNIRRRFAPAAALGLCCALALLDEASAISVQSHWVVFFDFGRTEINVQSGRALLQVAEAYRRYGGDRQLVVTGHSDAAEASEALSQSRGDAVRERLAALGIPVERILVFANGDARPLVKAMPKMQEPQNRYVEVFFAAWNSGR